jgi:hypothetical protein
VAFPPTLTKKKNSFSRVERGIRCEAVGALFRMKVAVVGFRIRVVR